MPHQSGHLTNAEMHAAFDRGRTVIHNGRHLLTRDEIPADSDIEYGTNADLATIQADLDRQVAEIEARKARLNDQLSALQRADAQAEADFAAQQEAEQKATAKAAAEKAGAKTGPDKDKKD